MQTTHYPPALPIPGTVRLERQPKFSESCSSPLSDTDDWQILASFCRLWGTVNKIHIVYRDTKGTPSATLAFALTRYDEMLALAAGLRHHMALGSHGSVQNVTQSLLGMAISKGGMTDVEAKRSIQQTQRREFYNRRNDNGRRGFVVDLELALRDSEAVLIQNLVVTFEEALVLAGFTTGVVSDPWPTTRTVVAESDKSWSREKPKT